MTLKPSKEQLELSNVIDLMRAQHESSIKKLEQFIYNEITERRDYNASKMCEVILEKMEKLKLTKITNE